ncbi:MAG: hypothetical protein ACMUIE_07200 [Thermoplasmatota archaeon]
MKRKINLFFINYFNMIIDRIPMIPIQWQRDIGKIMFDMPRPFRMIILGQEDDLNDLLETLEKSQNCRYVSKPEEQFEENGIELPAILGETLAEILDYILIVKDDRSLFRFLFYGYKGFLFDHDGTVRELNK